MKSFATVVTACTIALSWVAAVGQETDSHQQKYFNYWKPHVGVWKITIKEEGKEHITGIFHYRPSPTKLSYIGRGKDEDGTPIVDGLYAYDPGHKCWVDVQIRKLGNSYWYRTGLLRADVGQRLREGSKVSLEVTESREGETIKYKATRIYETVSKERIVMVHRNRTTPEGKSLPDVTVICDKKK